MIRWLRVVLPDLQWLVLFAAGYGLWVACFLWLERWFGVSLGAPLPELQDLRRAGTIVILGSGAVLYGLVRGVGFHPVGLPDYRAWLAATPWTGQKPLPFGPVHLVPQDVFLAGSAVLLAWLSGDGWVLWAPQVFLAVYLLAVTGNLFSTGCWPWGYAVAFGLGLAVHLWRAAPAGLAVELLTYVAAYLGLRQSLARFPWGDDWGRRLGRATEAKRARDRIDAQQFGWPFGRLAPNAPDLKAHLERHHALLLSLLVGWWVYACFSLIPLADDRLHGLAILDVAVLLVPALRSAIYCVGYLPPISLFGRVATGRWIIPGYDKVFVAPLLAVGVGLALIGLGTLLGLDPLCSQPVAISAVLLISLGMGPSLRAWRLTGEHQIVAGPPSAGAVKVG